MNKLNDWVSRVFLSTQSGRIFLSVLAFPLIAVAIYLYVLAPDRYESRAIIKVEVQGGMPLANSFLESFSVGAASTPSDEQLLEAFIASPDLMLALDKELNIKEHYANTWDFVFGLSKTSTLERFLQLYQQRVVVLRDVKSGLLVIKVHAYDPVFAQTLANTVLKNSEQFINDAGDAIAKKEMAFALGEIKRSQELLKKAKANMLAFQNKYNLVSPNSEGESLMSIIYELETDKVKTQAELSQVENYLNPNAPQTEALKNKIEALSKEILEQKNRLTGSTKNGNQLNQLTVEFESLKLDVELATTIYTSALSAYEVARVQAGKQLKHLIVAGHPYLPEEALYPKRLYWLITWAIIFSALAGVVRMVLLSISEHRD